MIWNRMKPSAQSSPRKSRGVLTLIGGLLFLSALVRLAPEAGQVWAQDTRNPIEIVNDPNLGGSALMSEDMRKEVRNLLEKLQEREAMVAQKEKDILVRQRTVEVAEGEILAKLEELKQAEDSLRETLAIASTAAEDDLSRLTDVYANMKPKQAAALFEKMDASFAAGFLSRMPSEAAAKIMAGMTPDKAYLVSVTLASRNAEASVD